MSGVLTNNTIKFFKNRRSIQIFRPIDLSVNVDTKTHPARETVPLVDKILPPILHRYEDTLRLFYGLDQFLP